MSREIKFRGQTRRKGERIINLAGDKCEANWAYGGIFPQNNGGDFAIIYEQPSCEKRVVYADTVGQYIGVKDKNRKEIYEGDILRRTLLPTRRIENFFKIVYVSSKCCFCAVDLDGSNVTFISDYINSSYEIEIIGNIYDNPDLLKEVGCDIVGRQWLKDGADEAIKVLKTHNDKCSGCDCLCNDLCKPAVDMAIKALEDLKTKEKYIKQILWERDIAISQLEEIGISLGEKMDSVKEAMERQRRRKPDRIYKTRYIWDSAYCPVCGCGITARWTFCQNCGQAIDWPE